MSNLRRGFTLIELLVVIAIIALLAAILFPVFARARENARKSSCLNNIKQLGVGVQQYTQDYDETLPSSTDGNPDGINVIGGWVFYSAFGGNGTGVFDVTKGSLYPYVKGTQVYVCPSDTFGKRSGNSYAINACMVSGTRTAGIRPGRPLANFNDQRSVSQWMLFGEENAGGSTDDGYLSTGNTWTPRHLQGTNLAFLDGHVKFVLVENGQTRPINFQYAGGTACPP